MTKPPKLPGNAAAYLVLEGEEVGEPEGPAYQQALEAMESIRATLRAALDRTGHAAARVGALEKEVQMRVDGTLPTWHWNLRCRVPGEVTTTVLEFAKYLAHSALPVLILRGARKKRTKAPQSTAWFAWES